MPKLRQTCTRCSMRRQKCDRKTPCSRCIQNKEGHLCTTEWANGYDPNVHRKYPKKATSPASQHSIGSSNSNMTQLNTAQPYQHSNQPWPNTPLSDHEGTPFRDPSTGLPLASRPYSTAPPLNTGSSQPPDLPTSSTNLDFVTFARSGLTDVSISALFASRDEDPTAKVIQDRNLEEAQRSSRMQDNGSIFASGFSPAARAVEVYHLRSLIPTKEQVLHMADYHERCMLYWSGGIYHAPTFRRTLLEAYGESNELELGTLEWTWTALLFSIMSAAIIASPEGVTTSWGFAISDKVRLGKLWGNATISCLQIGDYASKFHVQSVQAIMNMHTTEHLVGSTKEWVVFQASAIVISRGLGFHRLGPHVEDGKSNLNALQKEALLQREIGRRIWSALTSQDWLCATSTGSYSIQRRHFTSIMPGHYDEETMTPITDGRPTFAHPSNYLHEVAYNLISYHDEFQEAADVSAKYQVILKFDARMRSMSVDRLPKCLTMRTPLNPTWPRWVSWARRLHQVSWAHKVIMIHQSFLGRSFKSPQFTYSRWACVSSARFIIDLMYPEPDPDEPQWWIEQAFVVTSGICIAVDMFHRSDKESEARENHQYVEKTVQILERWTTSSLASHGLRLLSSLLQEYNKKIDASRPDPPPSVARPIYPENMAPASLAEAAQDHAPATDSSPQAVDAWYPNMDVDMAGFENFAETLPADAGLDNNMFYESMMSLANSQFW
ncbi:hypothetical protein P154DRAFT_116401 [Amniculicola lignicola CBS 123094]|uniref:Zn(2)-C6 fungal-type domain-containing protein n=1 Tax=Amniculicola lignicola CBS 123094 TaxID=1392246 RepID=A0A6A5X0S8_9PLEO|nr:hypothetical protein P154DRAFT_116401 [Amniculicola lignicola CBS 123094]